MEILTKTQEKHRRTFDDGDLFVNNKNNHFDVNTSRCASGSEKMPYGISAYGQSPQIGSPLQHTGSLIQQHMVGSGATAIYAGSESNGSPAAAVVSSTALQTASSTSSLFRSGEEKRLTREAMERYLRDRNDMIIVVLHAKVITDVGSP